MLLRNNFLNAVYSYKKLYLRNVNGIVAEWLRRRTRIEFTSKVNSERCVGISRAGSNPADVVIFLINFLLHNKSISIKNFKVILPSISFRMGKINSSKRSRPPPEGYSKIEPTLNKLLLKLKEAQSSTLKTDTKNTSLWKVIQVNHQISRYIYNLYYQKKVISKELYEWLSNQKYCNKDLIAKWKKQGYENLCCINCIMKSEKNHNSTCICRVPKHKLEEKEAKDLQCITCGCRGCASTD